MRILSAIPYVLSVGAVGLVGLWWFKSHRMKQEARKKTQKSATAGQASVDGGGLGQDMEDADGLEKDEEDADGLVQPKTRGETDVPQSHLEPTPEPSIVPTAFSRMTSAAVRELATGGTLVPVHAPCEEHGLLRLVRKQMTGWLGWRTIVYWPTKQALTIPTDTEGHPQTERGDLTVWELLVSPGALDEPHGSEMAAETSMKVGQRVVSRERCREILRHEWNKALVQEAMQKAGPNESICVMLEIVEAMSRFDWEESVPPVMGEETINVLTVEPGTILAFTPWEIFVGQDGNLDVMQSKEDSADIPLPREGQHSLPLLPAPP
ncbi:uncharacterized protein LOC136715827 [Amia ocellicauda]|uniref:uncharacterized protein LOC136715827 n=1 Tax=Amia ocellicauda TaxID=2972642 RepID=UPI003464D9F1